MIELFECAPMMARISRKQCEFNRSRKDDGTKDIMADGRCKGCAGLGSAVAVNSILEGTEMRSGTRCAIRGCGKQAQVKGFCKVHLKTAHPDVYEKNRLANLEYMRKKKAAAVVVDAPVRAEDMTVDVVDESGWVQPVMVQAAVVSAQEIRSIDQLAFMRQVFEEKFEEWATDLRQAETPYLRAKYYILMCDSAKSLGY